MNMSLTLTNIPNLPASVAALLDAMNANNDARRNSTRFGSPYIGFEVSEARRKYFLLNSVLTNGQRSGVFLIDKETLTVYRSVAYGKAGRAVGTCESIAAAHNAGTATYAAGA